MSISKSIFLPLVLGTFLLSKAAIGYDLPCSAATGCKFVVRPGMGWHVKLTDINKGFQYSCKINTIAPILRLNTAEADKIGITNLELIQKSGLEKVLNFSSENMTVDNGYILFDTENTSDIPIDESINCVTN